MVKSAFPVTATLEKVVAPPALVTPIVCVGVPLFTVTLPKFRLIGLKVKEVALPIWKAHSFAVS